MSSRTRPYFFAALAIVIVVAGVLVGRHLRSGTTSLAADFDRLTAKLHAVAGLTVVAVGGRQASMALGHWQTGPAWSTIKVPLVIAALREARPPKVTDAMTKAITESDNAAAESLWTALGDPAAAATKVDAVLRQAGDPTVVQSRKVRPEFTAFGQTDWSLADQVRFLSVAVCDKANAPIFALMGRVEPDQRWGVGTIQDARFKGGWGPSATGSYLVRQMGILASPKGMAAVALAAQPDSGTFEDGKADLTEMADWLSSHLSSLPSGPCG
jgi:hypothetical protein